MKKLILFLLLFLPFMVYAEVCSVIEDTQTASDRTLTCDANSTTVTTFSTKSSETVLDNGVCQIKCTEELILSIDPMKKVLAGTSFNYPLYVSGERKCTATYDYTTYETNIRKLVNEYSSLTGDAKTTKGNELVNYYTKKKECDEFTKEDSDYQKKYSMNGKVTLDVETSTSVDKLVYSYKNISDYNSQVNTDEIRYYACDYNENIRKCNESMRTISTWTETARIFGKYTMPNSYLERYTGEVKSSSTATTCNAGDRYFVSFNELTKPVATSIDDNGYKLTLVAINLGNNLKGSGTDWKLTTNCWYKVKNLAFPQGGTSGGNEDENYPSYGNNAFVFRQIDINNPFPDRDPGANWYGRENLILSTKDKIDKMSKFEITLNRSIIKNVREWNTRYPYDTFNLNEMEKSIFLINNFPAIVRK